ncbi:hypothetical protein IW150_004397, partial [Coemansia sp. RSA 2607]
MATESSHMAYVIGALIAAGIAYILLGTGDKAKKAPVTTTGKPSTSAVEEAVLHASEYRKFKLVSKVQL